MLLTEQSGTQMWQKMLKENFNVQDTDKLGWVSEYAANHEVFESNLGVNGGGFVPGNNGVGPMYTTPLNTTGMGNPMAPGYGPTGQVPMGYPGSGANGQGQDFAQQRVGSGDVPLTTLPMGLNIALMTIGLELLPVIPTKGPWHLISYMDMPYAGGKLNVAGNLTSMDGKGKGNENKPLYVKFLGANSSVFTPLKGKVKENDTVEVTSGDVTFTGKFKSFGRMDGGLIVEVVECKDSKEDVAIADLFTTGEEVKATANSVEVVDE